MKKLVIILSLLTLLTIQTKATECSVKIFQEEKINLYLCQNYSAFQETRVLLFKARTKVLNDYIKDKIAKGELEDKKFEIQIYDQILSNVHLFLTQGRNGYFVTLSGYPSLQELKAIVDYFSKSDWKPIIIGAYDCENKKYENAEIANKRIFNFYQQNISTTTIPYQPFAIWEKEGVSLQYSGDSLKYVIDNIHLRFRPTSALPVKIKDRYLFFQSDSIFVLQDMQTIKKLNVEEPYSYNVSEFDTYVFPKWINICWGGKDNWVYSYSYDKNRFYKNKE
jgi:hypothetical protein